MIENIFRDVAVIGAGAAGLAAAAETAKAGCSTILLERDDRTGGILNQCIHNGFGLHLFKKELTGPEFAAEIAIPAVEAGVEIRLSSSVNKINRLADGRFQLEVFSADKGITLIECRAVILTAGCRERNRGNLAIPGSRPAGIWTAGTAQKLLNVEGVLPGKRAVIVGSGDIGLIMARRLRWCGAEVAAVIEILPQPSGLIRNIAQCLDDFGIPLLLKHQVTNIFGRDRVTGLEAAPHDNFVPDMSKKIYFDCDTVLFSVGLLPSTELILPLGVEIDPSTGGAVVDSNCETSVPGIFCAGNVLHVHDLVDYVAEEAREAGIAAARRLKTSGKSEFYPAEKGSNLRYVAPVRFEAGAAVHFRFRPTVTAERAKLNAYNPDGSIAKSWNLQFVNPAEMIQVEHTPAAAALKFELEVVK